MRGRAPGAVLRAVLLVGLTLGLPVPMGAQQPLSAVAESARSALARGRVSALFQGADRVQLQLPDAQPSSAVAAGQAIAALRGALARGDGDRVTVARYREVGEGLGYVELRRDVVGQGGEPQRQRILLGYRRSGGGLEPGGGAGLLAIRVPCTPTRGPL